VKTFRFSLEQILELRLEEEQEAELRLGRAMGEWNLMNQRKLDREATKARTVLSPDLSAEDIFQTSLYLTRVDQEIRRIGREMEEKEQVLESLREEYRNARARREGLDKLKEKRRAEHQKKEMRREAQILDDLSNGMIRMNNRNGE